MSICTSNDRFLVASHSSSYGRLEASRIGNFGWEARVRSQTAVVFNNFRYDVKALAWVTSAITDFILELELLFIESKKRTVN